MYRIKAPKGGDGYYVPILANPDIVEHYSENVVDNLHKKNLLLLGEDRYLTTLMLKTFPKRKMMFCPQAYCKTVVPDTFRVLLSQRRRWINSTIHNLFELLLVRDLCGTFCFSMQFVVFMELVGTLVLPAAIAFTIYILVLTCIPNREKPIIVSQLDLDSREDKADPTYIAAAHPACVHPWFARSFDRGYKQKDRLCRVDDSLPVLATNLECGPSSIRLLPYGRFQLGIYKKDTR